LGWNPSRQAVLWGPTGRLIQAGQAEQWMDCGFARERM
jgi:hypothetical protein